LSLDTGIAPKKLSGVSLIVVSKELSVRKPLDRRKQDTMYIPTDDRQLETDDSKD